MPGWVYILECSDGSYYVGSTKNVELRLQQHQTGNGGIYTASRRPLKLKWSLEFPNIKKAFEVEHQVKKWSRAKKESLMKGDYDRLRLLSRKIFKKN